MHMATEQAQTRLDALIAEEWEYRVREDPIFATRCGDHRYNDRLPSLKEADFERRAAQARDFLTRLASIPREDLPPAARLNADFFQTELESQLAEFQFGAHFTPLARIFGPQVYLPELVDISPFNTVRDYENYIQRLRGVPDLLQDHIELMRAGIQAGYTAARPALEGVDASLQAQVVGDPSASPFYPPFEKFPAGIPAAERARLAQMGAAAILESVVPGFSSLLQYVQAEALPGAREAVGSSALPDGEAFYAYRVRRYTSLDLTPRQVHDMGLGEVRRIRAEMEDLLHTVGFQGSLREFADALRQDPRFFVQTPEELLSRVALIAKRMDGELPRLFSVLPRTPYGIRQIPEAIAPGNTTAYYFPPTGDGSTAGFYYVNTYDLNSRPLYEYEALTLHEAVPGHHLQLALQIEMDGLPNFRRFGEATAFIEGWGLYAERLGLEAGFYQDPYSDFGRLVFEMWRAARLVVDTGLHAFGWTRQRAIDYMADNTALALLNIANEVDRYIAWPGQALAYKVGELKIRELRAAAEQRLGPRFDLRRFHDALLSEGGIPLKVLEQNIFAWLEEESTKAQ